MHPTAIVGTVVVPLCLEAGSIVVRSSCVWGEDSFSSLGLLLFFSRCIQHGSELSLHRLKAADDLVVARQPQLLAEHDALLNCTQPEGELAIKYAQPGATGGTGDGTAPLHS